MKNFNFDEITEGTHYFFLIYYPKVQFGEGSSLCLLNSLPKIKFHLSVDTRMKFSITMIIVIENLQAIQKTLAASIS